MESEQLIERIAVSRLRSQRQFLIGNRACGLEEGIPHSCPERSTCMRPRHPGISHALTECTAPLRSRLGRHAQMFPSRDRQEAVLAKGFWTSGLLQNDAALVQQLTGLRQ